MIQVLFVDDDESVTRDLCDMLAMAGADWAMNIANSGEGALEVLDAGHFDVIVADMKMHGMDGAELLAIVRDRYPDVMRILMSGNVDVNFTARLVPQAHQFLQKPCTPSLVINVVERAYELGQRLADSELRRTLAQITDLPRPPENVLRLNALLDSPDAGIEEVAELVEHDVALTARIFKLVNSAFYGLSREIDDVAQAINYVGLNMVRNLAVSVEMMRTISSRTSVDDEVIQELNDHGGQVAQVARQLVLVREQANEAFVAGLLHDIGFLVLVAHFPDRFAQLREAAQRSELPITDLELDVIGANHADIGAYLLNLWGLPFHVVEAVARHHDAFYLPERRMDATHAVGIADAIINSNSPTRLMRESTHHALDKSYLEELGVLERVAGLMAVSVGSPEPDND